MEAKTKMNKLQKLALKHIEEMAECLDDKAIKLSATLGLKKEEFEAEKHTYPIASKAREIGRWTQAILESDN